MIESIECFKTLSYDDNYNLVYTKGIINVAQYKGNKNVNFIDLHSFLATSLSPLIVFLCKWCASYSVVSGNEIGPVSPERVRIANRFVDIAASLRCLLFHFAYSLSRKMLTASTNYAVLY